jgi:hypothetical protein
MILKRTSAPLLGHRAQASHGRRNVPQGATGNDAGAIPSRLAGVPTARISGPLGAIAAIAKSHGGHSPPRFSRNNKGILKTNGCCPSTMKGKGRYD